MKLTKPQLAAMRAADPIVTVSRRTGQPLVTAGLMREASVSPLPGKGQMALSLTTRGRSMVLRQTVSD